MVAVRACVCVLISFSPSLCPGPLLRGAFPEEPSSLSSSSVSADGVDADNSAELLLLTVLVFIISIFSPHAQICLHRM